MVWITLTSVHFWIGTLAIVDREDRMTKSKKLIPTRHLSTVATAADTGLPTDSAENDHTVDPHQGKIQERATDTTTTTTDTSTKKIASNAAQIPPSDSDYLGEFSVSRMFRLMKRINTKKVK